MMLVMLFSLSLRLSWRHDMLGHAQDQGIVMAFGIDDAIAAGLQIINKFVPDPAQKQAAEDSLRSSLQAWDGQQNAVNTVEGANASVFV